MSAGRLQPEPVCPCVAAAEGPRLALHVPVLGAQAQRDVHPVAVVGAQEGQHSGRVVLAGQPHKQLCDLQATLSAPGSLHVAAQRRAP